ncbi:MAG: DUF1559 domain-containing protein [Verrucomicrobiota bacterium]
MTSKQHGFTLVELLTTITIVAILIALASFSAKKAIASVNNSKCSNQLRQIGVAINLYTGEMGHYPPATIVWNSPGYISGSHVQGSWWDQISEHLGTKTTFQRKVGSLDMYYNPVLHCPSSTISTETPYASYGCNTQVMQDVAYGNGQLVSAMRVNRPSEIVLVTDTNQNSGGSSSPHLWRVNPSTSEGSSEDPLPICIDSDGGATNYIRYRHNGATNCLFADGHVESKKKGTLKNRNWVINY